MTDRAQPAKPKGGYWLWIFVILAFAFLISAWTTLIVIAVNNQPERIEIER